MKLKFYITIGFLFSFMYLKAHESRPVFIQIKQEKEFVKISYSVPNTVDFRNLPHFQLPPNFKQDSTQRHIKSDTEGYLFEDVVEGKIQDLKGQTMTLKFPYFNPTLSSVIQIYYENEPETYVLSPEKNVLDLTEKTKNTLQSQAFIGLGVEHIFKGIDHLLFVVCLLIITGIGRKLFWTITGFTIAHSITLFLSVLGLVNIPVPFVEVCIALSIIFLCCEILRGYQNKKSLTYQYPFLISSAFGLLHGLGFAAVLKEIGLPENSVFSSLLFFNVGVEIGQIVFIGFLIACLFVLKYFFKSMQNNSIFLLKIATYCIGTMASFWFFERIAMWYF